MILCTREYINRSNDLLVFADLFGGQNVALFWEKREPEKLQKFVATVQAEIERRHRQREEAVVEEKSGATLAGELRELAKLRDEGMLSMEEFEQAKQALLGSGTKPDRAIGFSLR